MLTRMETWKSFIKGENQMRTITMKFNGDSVKIEVDGCVDGSCKQITEAVEKALGTATNIDYKPEFYQAQEEYQQQ